MSTRTHSEVRSHVVCFNVIRVCVHTRMSLISIMLLCVLLEKVMKKPSPVSGIANVRHIECCNWMLESWNTLIWEGLVGILRCLKSTSRWRTFWTLYWNIKRNVGFSAFVFWLHVATLLKRRESLLWSKMRWKATVVDSVFEMLARVSETWKAQTSMASWHCLKCCSNSHFLDASWPIWPLWLCFWMDLQLKK